MTKETTSTGGLRFWKFVYKVSTGPSASNSLTIRVSKFSSLHGLTVI